MLGIYSKGSIEDEKEKSAKLRQLAAQQKAEKDGELGSLLSTLGTLGGAAVGTFLAPGLGTATGAQLGGMIGGGAGQLATGNAVGGGMEMGKGLAGFANQMKEEDEIEQIIKRIYSSN
jgi:outer membrane lipoprotein SlyB